MDTSRKPPDVEPLSEARWSRIERGLFARVADGEAATAGPVARAEPAPRWRMAAAVLAGGLAAIGGGVAWHTFGPAPRSAAVAPSVITTDAAGSQVSVGEAVLAIAPRSTVVVSGDDAHGVTVVLERGRVECEVPPRRGRPPFSVVAGEVTVHVVGTHFAVARSESDVGVDVQRGVVDVASRGAHVDVHAGESWPMGPAAAPAGSTAPPPASASSPVASPAAPVPAPPAASIAAPTPRDIYESASALEASRPDLALTRYRELAARGGPWGMNALFAEGRLQADRRHAAEARSLLQEYLARYPGGPNADDARQLLERLR